jgi:hypothetical protein
VYSLGLDRQEQHCSLSGKSQVLIAPSRMHDAGGRVRVLAEKQVAQFMCDDTAQNHFEFPAIRKFPNPVRVHIGHYSKSFIIREERGPENVAANS